MKIDYEYMKQILNILKENESHFMRSDSLMKRAGVDLDSDDDTALDKFAGHILLLADVGCLECPTENYGLILANDDSWCVNSSRYRLTSHGYQFHDALSKQSVFDKIKDHSISIAIEAGKQLLIEALKKGIIG